jgi:hypothetical protein
LHWPSSVKFSDIARSSYSTVNGHVKGAFTLPEDLADMGVLPMRGAGLALAHRMARDVALLWLRDPHGRGGSAVFHQLWSAVVQVRQQQDAAAFPNCLNSVQCNTA